MPEWRWFVAVIEGVEVLFEGIPEDFVSGGGGSAPEREWLTVRRFCQIRVGRNKETGENVFQVAAVRALEDGGLIQSISALSSSHISSMIVPTQKLIDMAEAAWKEPSVIIPVNESILDSIVTRKPAGELSEEQQQKLARTMKGVAQMAGYDKHPTGNITKFITNQK